MSIIQSQDNTRFEESKVDSPSESFAQQYPLFCLRLSFARLVNRYLKLNEEALDMGRAAQRVDSLHSDIASLKDSMPIDWRPENVISAEPGEHQCILVLHFEYYTLLLMMSTTVERMAYFNPNQVCQNVHGVHPQAKGRVQNARRILQTFDTIQRTPEFNPGLTCW